jgi:hypothetical protein
MDHAHGLANPARLCELDVDAVGIAGDGGHVAQVVAALVDYHGRPRREFAQRTEGVEVGRGKGLLDELYPELNQCRHQLARRIKRPALVRVNAQRSQGLGAHGLEARQVVRAAKLDLERAVATRPPHPVASPLDAVDTDRVGGWPRLRE